MSQGTLRYGLAILARLDPRLMRATLASVRNLADAPDHIVVVVAKAHQHMASGLPAADGKAPVEPVIAEESEMVAAGIAALAPHTDIAVVVPEGVVFEPDYLRTLRDRVEPFADRVGGVDLVHRVVKIDAEAAGDRAEIAIGSGTPEWPIVSTLRALLSARSLMGAVFWARTATLGQIKFTPTTEASDVITFASALDQLRPRGRTEILFTPAARRFRLVPERRSGYQAGYGLSRKLCQIDEVRRSAASLGGPAPVHLDPWIEQARLFAEQGLRFVLSPVSRRHAETFLAGMRAARRDARAVRRTIQREVREMR